MFRNLLSTTSLAFLLIFASCEVPVDLDVEDEAKIVVQSYFSENQDLIAYVSKSKLRSEGGNTEYIENASVSLFVGEEHKLTEILTFVPDADPPYYITSDLSPEVGTTYTLSVDVPGFKPITASNKIPIPVPINDIIFDNSTDIINDGDFEINFDIIVSISDPVEYQNFYHLLFSQEIIPYELSPNGDTIRKQAIIFNSNENLFVRNKTREDYEIFQVFEYPNFLIEDKNFNGQEITVRFCGNYSFNPTLFVPGEFSIELRTTSKAYYDHYNSVVHENQPGAGGGFDPGAASGNVNNGFGVFAGYSSNLSTQKISN
ncbi:MAG TPA: DUF4249 domain-containing protein [Bacteroidetes bacterium]|nr:DUF4249 domain-containing protein [Bacteroidota bacterium]